MWVTVKFKVLKFCLRLIHTTTIISYHFSVLITWNVYFYVNIANYLYLSLNVLDIRARVTRKPVTILSFFNHQDICTCWTKRQHFTVNRGNVNVWLPVDAIFTFIFKFSVDNPNCVLVLSFNTICRFWLIWHDYIKQKSKTEIL